jgi:hypothetical protein
MGLNVYDYILNENITDRFADVFYSLSKINVLVISAKDRTYE